MGKEPLLLGPMIGPNTEFRPGPPLPGDAWLMQHRLHQNARIPHHPLSFPPLEPRRGTNFLERVVVVLWGGGKDVPNPVYFNIYMAQPVTERY